MIWFGDRVSSHWKTRLRSLRYIVNYILFSVIVNWGDYLQVRESVTDYLGAE